MPEHLRAFLVISLLMAVAYAISRRLFAHAVEPKFVGHLYATGYSATAIMFLAHDMWVFLGGLALLSLLAARRFTYPLALFVFLLLLMPEFSVRVPGFGLINWLIDLNAWRILALTVLLPATLFLLHNAQLPRPGKLVADKLVIGYVLYTTLLSYIHYETFTGGMRHLASIILDMALLYFVASRGLMLKGAVRHVMVALVIAAIYLALAGAFEFAKHWLLYSSLKSALGSSGMFGYLGRGDTLRALATTGQPIALGFVMMLALLATVYVQKLVPPGLNRAVLWGLMSLGLVAAMSRGPWVGAATGLFVVALVSANPVGNVLKLAVAGLSAAILLVMLPGGEKIIDYLPWVGTIDSTNVTYRELLWQQALLVVDNHFWLGSIGFTELPEFDVIRQGGGFVDIVNSYLGIALVYGVIGLGFFVFLIVLTFAQNVMSALRNSLCQNELQTYRLTLVGMFSSMVVAIWTVSSISQIAPLITLLIGAGVANICLSAQINKTVRKVLHNKGKHPGKIDTGLKLGNSLGLLTEK